MFVQPPQIEKKRKEKQRGIKKEKEGKLHNCKLNGISRRRVGSGTRNVDMEKETERRTDNVNLKD